MEKLKIVRHIEEDQTSKDIRDGSINGNETKVLMDFYIPEILKDLESDKYNSVVIISSDKARSTQTSELLKSELSKYSRLSISTEIDSRSSAQFHGKYKPDVDNDNSLVKKAKSIYLKETFEKGNFWYRYGDTKNGSGEESYPELSEVFIEPGENQIELSLRMYSLCLDLLEKIRQHPKTLFILSTHYLTMSRLLALESIAKTNGSSGFFHAPGELYQREWEATQDLVKETSYKDFFKENNYVFDVDFSKIDEIKHAIELDLDILLAKCLKYYGKPI